MTVRHVLHQMNEVAILVDSMKAYNVLEVHSPHGLDFVDEHHQLVWVIDLRFVDRFHGVLLLIFAELYALDCGKRAFADFTHEIVVLGDFSANSNFLQVPEPYIEKLFSSYEEVFLFTLPFQAKTVSGFARFMHVTEWFKLLPR
jgi:hypothetical protein